MYVYDEGGRLSGLIRVERDTVRVTPLNAAELREELSGLLRSLGWKAVPGVANFVLCDLPDDGPDAATGKSGLAVGSRRAIGTALSGSLSRLADPDGDRGEDRAVPGAGADPG